MTHHHFQPQTYWNNFGSHPPALHIRHDDTVITSTIDAAGLDQAGLMVIGLQPPNRPVLRGRRRPGRYAGSPPGRPQPQPPHRLVAGRARPPHSGGLGSARPARQQ